MVARIILKVPPMPPRKAESRGRKTWWAYEKTNFAGASEKGKGGYAVTGKRPVTDAKSWSRISSSMPGKA
jgi:hypothetical protein